MTKNDDDGIGPIDALGVPLKNEHVSSTPPRGAAAFSSKGVITRVTPGICIRRWDGKVITIGTFKRIAVLPQREPDSKPPQVTWAEFCRRNREHWPGKWADEELRA